MSSTYARYQTPVHTTGHPQREPQQPYINYEFSSYSSDSRSLLADDVHSYAHAEDLYNPGCSYVPYEPECSQFEETEEGFGYGPIPSNNYASPQLLCPKPILPPSQFSPHYAWYDWPSEAPANIYPAEQSRYTTGTSHLSPQTGEIVHHSFGNQQFSKISSQPELTTELIPNPLTSNHLGGRYTPQPFVAPVPSFDQVPSRSTHFNFRSGFYNTAHEPVSPEQHSSYSELAPNLKFMNNQTTTPPSLGRHHHQVHHNNNKKPSLTSTSSTQDFSLPAKPKNDNCATTAKGTILSSDIEKNPFALGFDGPPLTAFGRKKVPLSLQAPVLPPPPPTTTTTRPVVQVSFPVPFNPSKNF